MSAPSRPKDRSDDKDCTKHPASSPWEWVAAAAGLAIVAAIVGYLVYFGVSEHGRIPAIEIRVMETQATPAGHVVRIRVVNRGGATAAALRIKGELREGDAVVEDADTEIDYVPPHSERTASLVFKADPATRVIEIRPTSFTDP
ncbi:MAG: hypothetical protein ABW026_02565 [Microvirga sp.]